MFKRGVSTERFENIRYYIRILNFKSTSIRWPRKAKHNKKFVKTQQEICPKHNKKFAKTQQKICQNTTKHLSKHNKKFVKTQQEICPKHNNKFAKTQQQIC